MSDIIEFIKQHWVAYLVGIVLAIALGLGASLFILRVGSTPGGVKDGAAQSTTDTGSSESSGIRLVDFDW